MPQSYKGLGFFDYGCNKGAKPGCGQKIIDCPKPKPHCPKWGPIKEQVACRVRIGQPIIYCKEPKVKIGKPKIYIKKPKVEVAKPCFEFDTCGSKVVIVRRKQHDRTYTASSSTGPKYHKKKHSHKRSHKKSCSSSSSKSSGSSSSSSSSSSDSCSGSSSGSSRRSSSSGSGSCRSSRRSRSSSSGSSC
jgi:hypothetical protein